MLAPLCDQLYRLPTVVGDATAEIEAKGGLYAFAVLGGGLAGLSFAAEATRRGHRVLVLEREGQLGGLSRTEKRDGFRFDLGGHRFHSRDPAIKQRAFELMGDPVLEVRRRSRIYFDGRYVDYPLRLPGAIAALSPAQAVRVGASYLARALRRGGRTPDDNFERWIVNRFGRQLYDIYFRPYTEKVWGLPCDQLEAELAASRVRVASFADAVADLLRREWRRGGHLGGAFSYPALGIGVIADSLAAEARGSGNVDIEVSASAQSLRFDQDTERWRIGYRGGDGPAAAQARSVISTVPLPALCGMLPGDGEGGSIDCDLSYRSLICVLVTAKGDASTKDTWTYFPESSVQFGRTHVPPNWSAQLAPPAKTSQCVEFFCTEGDEVWTASDAEIIDKTLTGLERVGQLLRSRVDDCWVVRVADAYPVYRLGYRDELERTRARLEAFPRLTLLGRTGSYRYDNMDRVLDDGRALAEELCAQRGGSGQ